VASSMLCDVNVLLVKHLPPREKRHWWFVPENGTTAGGFRWENFFRNSILRARNHIWLAPLISLLHFNCIFISVSSTITKNTTKQDEQQDETRRATLNTERQQNEENDPPSLWNNARCWGTVPSFLTQFPLGSDKKRQKQDARLP